jgi:hypothetical protein
MDGVGFLIIFVIILIAPSLTLPLKGGGNNPYLTFIDIIRLYSITCGTRYNPASTEGAID